MVVPFHAAQPLLIIGHDEERPDRCEEAVDGEYLLGHRESLLLGKRDMARMSRHRWRFSDIDTVILTMSENR
jgi:hypothetical protein